MKNTIITKIDPFLALLSFVLFFLVRKEVFPASVYLIAAIILALYYFPVKVVLSQHSKGYENGKNVIRTLSDLIISVVLAFSIAPLFLPDSVFFLTIMCVISIVNIAFAYLYIFKRYNIYHFATHFIFAMLCSYAIFA